MEMSNSSVDDDDDVNDGKKIGSRTINNRPDNIETTECDDENLDERSPSRVIRSIASPDNDSGNNNNILPQRSNDNNNDHANNNGNNGNNGKMNGNGNGNDSNSRDINHNSGGSRLHGGAFCHTFSADGGGGKIQMSSSSTNTSATTTMSVSTNSNSSLSSLGPQYNDNYGGATTTALNAQRRNDNNRWSRIIRRRWSSRSAGKPPAPPSQDLFLAQIRLLSTLTGGSIIIFLFSLLNIFAFSALMFTLASFSMLLYTIQSYILHIINSDDITLYDYLPLSLQDLLTTTTLHDYLIDDTGTSYSEFSYLLLYFLPGITTQQRITMAHNLPQRHMDTVFAPGGIARLILPHNIYQLLTPPNTHIHASHPNPNANDIVTHDDSSSLPITSAVAHIHNASPPRCRNRATIGSRRQLIEGDTGTGIGGVRDYAHDTNAISSHLSLTVIDEHDNGESRIERQQITPHNNDSENENGRSPVTMRDAFAGLVHTTANLVFGEAMPQTSATITAPSQEDEGTFYIENDLLQDMSYGDESDMVDQSITSSTAHDNSTSRTDDGVDAVTSQTESALEDSPTALPQIIPLLMNSLTSHSSPRLLPSTSQHPEREIEVQQNNILSTAISTMVETYSNTATGILTDTAETIVEANAPMVIRAGVTLSSISGIGLLGYLSNLTYGITGGGASVGRALQRRRSDGVGEFGRNTTSGRLVVTGLATTLLAGVFSAGSAVLLRSYVRRMAAARREEVSDGLDRPALSESRKEGDDGSSGRMDNRDRGEDT